MRKQIVTISTLAFLVTLCFIIDGQVLFGEGGIVNGQTNDIDLLPYQMSIYQLSSYFGIGESLMLKLLMLTFGFSFFLILADRLAVVASMAMWFIYWVICNSGIGYAYGADYFITFLLYYNIVLCIFRNKKDTHKYLILMLQLHLCLVYFFAGLGKMVGTDWWDGNAMWAVINTYGIDFFKNRADMFLGVAPILQALSIFTVLIELLYPALIFYKRTRVFTLISIIGLHAGIAIVMGFFTFGIVLIIMNLMAFGHYLNWEKALKWFEPRPRLQVEQS